MSNDCQKVLMIANGGKIFGGVENFFLQYYSHIDHKKIHCDFAFCRGNSMGGREADPAFSNSDFIVFDSFKHNMALANYFSLFYDLYTLLKLRNYDIVHVNTGIVYIQITCLLAAKKAGIKTFISHSHSTLRELPTGGFLAKRIKMLFRTIFSKIIVKKSTMLFACGKEAGIQLFGFNAIKRDNFYIIKNSFDTKTFLFDLETRVKMREKLKIGKDTMVIGTVGRLTKVKNPFFSLEVFKEVLDRNSNAKLLMIGDGDLYKQVKERTDELGINNNTMLLGARSDVSDLMQAMDIYIMPSIYEGLGIAALEAQTSGLKCYLSNTIPEETIISDDVCTLSVDVSPAVWAERILREYSMDRDRKNGDVLKSGYDINESAVLLQELYCKAYNIANDY